MLGQKRRYPRMTGGDVITGSERCSIFIIFINKLDQKDISSDSHLVLHKADMADSPNANAAAGELPPEVIAFAGKMYNAARAGDIEVFQQALPAGLPANMRNEKGDTLVGISFSISLRVKY